MSTKSAHILVVEDDSIVADLIKLRLELEGFRVTLVSDGLMAWELLTNPEMEFDTILLDRSMPNMDGLTLLNKLHSEITGFSIPVIMETSLGDKASVLEGMKAGAYYYLTKPLQPELLLVTVRAAVNQYCEYRQLKQSMRENERTQSFISQATLHFQFLEEVPLIVGWLVLLCPESDRSRVALGLHELLNNAVEHGNLGIPYAEKSRMLIEEVWFEELKRLEQLPENQAKRVEVRFERQPDALYFMIKDEGDGFEWGQYLDFDPERIFDPNGRGIATARLMGFDSLEYQGKGNVVLAKLLL